MKKLMTVGIGIVLGIILMVSTTIQASQLHIDPAEFANWEVVKQFPCPGGYEDIHLVLKNPNPSAELKQVVLTTVTIKKALEWGEEYTLYPKCTFKNGFKARIISIGYALKGVKYLFLYDIEAKKWILQ